MIHIFCIVLGIQFYMRDITIFLMSGVQFSKHAFGGENSAVTIKCIADINFIVGDTAWKINNGAIAPKFIPRWDIILN